MQVIRENIAFALVVVLLMFAIVDAAASVPRMGKTDVEEERDEEESRMTVIARNFRQLTVGVNGTILVTFVLSALFLLSVLFLVQRIVIVATSQQQQGVFPEWQLVMVWARRPSMFLGRLLLAVLIIQSIVSVALQTDPRMMYLVLLLSTVLMMIVAEAVRAAGI